MNDIGRRRSAGNCHVGVAKQGRELIHRMERRIRFFRESFAVVCISTGKEDGGTPANHKFCSYHFCQAAGAQKQNGFSGQCAAESIEMIQSDCRDGPGLCVECRFAANSLAGTNGRTA
jgi:hypothetical protein